MIDEIELLRQMQNHVKAKARKSLLHFMLATNKNYQVNWHHKLLCDRLSKLKDQKRQRIMIFQPPQTGKSEIVSRNLPAWLLGTNPDLRIILASYSADLATGFNRDNQKIMMSEEYQDIFPGTALNTKRVVTGNNPKRTANFFEIVGRGGYVFSVGVGGSTTGKSADVFVIDDPIKDWKQAYSATQRKAVIDWYNSVAQTRMSLDGHIIVMNTRWHEADIAGYLLDQAEKDPEATQWEVISLPMLGDVDSKYRHPKDEREQGEPLWPEFKGGRETMLEIRKSVGEMVWAALFQQTPRIEGGNIIKAQWIQYYNALPFDLKKIPGHRITQSWDLTFKETGTSYVVGVVIANVGADFYVIDFWRRKADIVTTLDAIKKMQSKYPLSSILIEDKANGPAVISILKKSVSRIIPVRPTAGKDERLHTVAPLFEAGNVYLPQNAPYTSEIINELQTFPNSTNDDIVDALSQGLNHYSKLSGTRHLEAMTRM